MVCHGAGLWPEDSSTPAMELEHHAQVCPVGLPVSRRMLQAFFTLLTSPQAYKGRKEERKPALQRMTLTELQG